MSKRDYSNYNVLDDDIRKEQEQESRQEQLGQSLSTQEVKAQTSNQSMNEITEKVDEQVEKAIEENKESDIQKIEKDNEGPLEKEDNTQQEYFNKQSQENEDSNLKKTLIKNNFFHRDNQTSDSTMPEYKRFYQQKERSNLFKWCMRVAKIAILVMLLPLWALIALGILLVIGGFLFAIAGFIGTGLFILGVVCFISSQVSLSIIALGISVAITSIAFGGIILIIFSAIIKWVIQLVTRYKRPCIKAKNKEVI